MNTYKVRYPHAAGHTDTVTVEAPNVREAVEAARAEVGSRWSHYTKAPVLVIKVKVTA